MSPAWVGGGRVLPPECLSG